mmetsp:Transcript_46579/g.68833  ORF Transcript_46579/g.68833 Transcript_46579/m.68833 type:complete len:95 (-) Transcript_46579:293-577(-)
MHPPLNRPHPDCQDAIEALNECHRTNSKIKFWACNDTKYELDRCFKKEKEDMLKRINSEEFDQTRETEDRYAGRSGWDEHWKKMQKEKQEKEKK